MKKDNKPYSIIKILEKRLNLSSYNDVKIPRKNYTFLLKLISELRNNIVHHSGLVEKDIMTNNLLIEQLTEHCSKK